MVAALLVKLPDFFPRRRGWVRDLLLASGVGGAVAVLTLAVTSGTFDTSLAQSMASLSVPEAKGQNIVNVILVDFRALDTFGEIVVIAAAATAALSLLRIVRPKRRTQPT